MRRFNTLPLLCPLPKSCYLSQGKLTGVYMPPVYFFHTELEEGDFNHCSQPDGGDLAVSHLMGKLLFHCEAGFLME